MTSRNSDLDCFGPAAGGRSHLTVAAAVAAALGALIAPHRAMAQAASASDVQRLKDQVQQLQRQIERLEAQQAAATAAAPSSTTVPAPAAAPAPPANNAPSFYAGPVKVTLGGWVELMVIERNRNEAADWASNFNGSIPFPNSHNYYLDEFHLSERQSRLQALAQGPGNSNWGTEAYVETDFGGVTGGNNNETTSFSPRVRHFYADLANKSGGWYLLFGQNWSLATAWKQGLNPRQENIPLTIDGQYIPGFTWLRVPQVRLVKTFGGMWSVGFSVENPAALVTSNSTTGAPAIPTFFSAPGASSAFITSITNISTDTIPDVVGKVAFEPGWGHYEAFVTNRWFRSRYIAAGAQDNRTQTGTGFGANMLVPVVPQVFDLQAAFLGGKGVGRYGSSQLPDATVSPSDGSLRPLRGFQALVGFALRPAPEWTFYAYAGKEEVDSQSYVVTVGTKTYGYGYGNPLFDNSGCGIEGAAACAANTSSISSGTLGGWWKFYQGTLGNAQIGFSDTYIRRAIFSGVGGDPSTNINIALVSFRYYPYQK